MSDHQTGVIQTLLGDKFGVNQTTIGRQLAKMGIPYCKREKIPKYSANQQQRVDELSGKLANNLYLSSVEVVMDDKKYFTLSGHNIPGNAGYYSSDKSKCSDKVRSAGKEKYKVQIWIAISARGISKLLIRPSKFDAINPDIYINECISSYLCIYRY